MVGMSADEAMARMGGGLVVSCQPVPGGPFDTVEGVLAFARAAAASGASGLRIEGTANVAAVTEALDLPVIGLIKRDLAGSPVRITPLLEDVAALADAGAVIIAVDATDCARPVPVAELLAAARRAGALAMADCATLADGQAALSAGADIVGSTLSGYTGGPVPALPDLALVRALAGLGAPVLAEGRYNSPALAAEAIRAGASAVVVGSAITRPEYVTEWFRDAIAAARLPARSDRAVLAFDIGGTKTLAALVRGRDVLTRRLVATDREVSAAGWAAGVASLAGEWEGRYDRIAVAATGLLRDGVWSSLNPDVLRIPGDFRLADALAAALHAPVVAVNDAQAWAWGEYRYGAGVARDLLFVTVSSGIGGGVVLGGRLRHGASGLAGSLGQILCGDSGSLEAVASGFGMAQAAQALGHQGDARAIFGAAAAGVNWATTIVAASAHALARALVGAQALLDPERVVIGGGVGLAPGYLDQVRAALASYDPALVPHLVPAVLGAEGGLIGVADLTQDRTNLCSAQ